MNQLKGTIYLRDNAWYKMENVIKMGMASFAKDRSNTYITGEVERGEYVHVIEIPLDKMKILDKCLKSFFRSHNVYKGGGTEFYDRCIIDLIEPYLKKMNIRNDEKTKEHYEDYIFEENGGELNKIKLRLRHSKSLGSAFTEEQDEYNYVRSINLTLDIQSPKEYVEKRDIHPNFIESPEEYFKSRGVWNEWYDFMGVDTLKFIQSKQEWINFCEEKNIKSLDDYDMCCDKYDVLPKEPACFYKDFTNIPTELGFNRNRNRRR